MLTIFLSVERNICSIRKTFFTFIYNVISLSFAIVTILCKIGNTQMLLLLLLYIDILGVFTEKHCNKPLEQNVVYILITTLSNTISHDFNDIKNKPLLS